VDLRDHILMRHKWRNSSRSFRGAPLDTRERKYIESMLPAFPKDVQILYAFGCPEYVVYSMGVPVLFYCPPAFSRKQSWIDTLAETLESTPALHSHRELIYLLIPMLNGVEAEEIMAWDD
jgi:hypothetical protein